ncbi:aspartate-semialdehyde dehydrogenase [Candidatus Peregrinibacteria bacterium]|nr:aspartate-semialdehyde dehydrogenase [Candidatus Peregrinibacteria bacterium]
MIKVGILGATGSVGQRFIQQLQNHPWFKLTELAASERSAGKSYHQAVKWFLDEPMPQSVKNMTVKPCDPTQLDCDLVFSGLDAEVAGEIEENFASHDFAVISNSKNHRFDTDVPLLIPEVNPDHINIINHQRKNRGYKKGFIVTNPNCSAIGLVIALKPLHDAFGVKRVFVTTMQALSGAGYPGVPSLDIIGNVIPFIGGEEPKIETETRKLLGDLKNNTFINSDMILSAHCNRVHVQDGHLECASIEFERKPGASDQEMVEAVKKTLAQFTAEPQKLKLPFAPQNPIHITEEENRPQPRADRNTDKGMAVTIGRIRPCNIFHVRFALLSHNTIRGAAGAAILNAELLYKKGFIG